MKINLALTSSGSAPAVAVIKALKNQAEIYFQITGLDMQAASSGNFLADRGRVVPGPDAPDFIDEVLGICRRHNIHCVIPIIDEELAVFARSREKFRQAGIRLIVNNPDTIALAKNKFSTYQFCLANKIKTPRTFLSGEGYKPGAGSYPLVLKPLDGRGSRDTAVAKSKKELDLYRSDFKNFIIQEFIRGDEYTIDIAASPRGEILQAVPRRRIAVKAGMSYKGCTLKSRCLMDFAKHVAVKFGIDGPANIQCIVGKKGIYLIEVNPKFSAGLPLTVAAGVNIPLLLVKLAFGLKTAKKELQFKDGLVMLRYWEEVFVPSAKICR